MTEDQLKQVFDYQLQIKGLRAIWFSSNGNYAITITTVRETCIIQMPQIITISIKLFDFEGLPFTCFSQLNNAKKEREIHLETSKDVIESQTSSFLTLSEDYTQFAYYEKSCDKIYYYSLSNGLESLFNQKDLKLEQIVAPPNIPEHLILSQMCFQSTKIELGYESIADNTATIFKIEILNN